VTVSIQEKANTADGQSARNAFMTGKNSLNVLPLLQATKAICVKVQAGADSAKEPVTDDFV
jgi:hypothetical protein